MDPQVQQHQRIRISRTLLTAIPESDHGYESIGASYTHVENLVNSVSANTTRIVMYHAKLTSLAGLENANFIQHAFLGFNRIASFRPKDAKIRVGVLDLAGNPITSLIGVPKCRDLIVSSTLIENLIGVPEGVEFIRCGHSTHLKSLKGCPQSVKLIECSCAPNLVIRNENLPANLQELIR